MVEHRPSCLTRSLEQPESWSGGSIASPVFSAGQTRRGDPALKRRSLIIVTATSPARQAVAHFSLNLRLRTGCQSPTSLFLFTLHSLPLLSPFALAGVILELGVCRTSEVPTFPERLWKPRALIREFGQRPGLVLG